MMFSVHLLVALQHNNGTVSFISNGNVLLTVLEARELKVKMTSDSASGCRSSLCFHDGALNSVSFQRGEDRKTKRPQVCEASFVTV